MHAEWGDIGRNRAALKDVRARGGRIVAVGTTSLRLLESAAGEDGAIAAWSGETSIFITPGYRFKAVDILMTNFHLPRSTLFMLVAAFSGLGTMRAAYGHAIRSGYRFYSYGDVSLLFQQRTVGMNSQLKDTMAEHSTFAFSRKTARRDAGKSQRRAVSSARRPSCRWHRRHGQSALPGAGARCRRRHHSWQHLSSDAAARRGAHRRARRPA